MHRDDSWNVSEEQFTVQGGPEQKLRFLLKYAVLAPSGDNTQPWLFRLSGNKVELYADRTRGLPVVDPEDRALIIGCGAALFYLRTALRHFGYAGEVEIFPDPDETDLLARVRLDREHEATEEEQRLFRAIPERHSNRQAFEDRQVPGRLLSTLLVGADRHSGRRRVLDRCGDRGTLGPLEGRQLQREVVRGEGAMSGRPLQRETEQTQRSRRGKCT
jgi:hypothetical protein